MSNLNPYKSPESVSATTEATFWRSASRMIAFAYGLVFIGVTVSSMPSRFIDGQMIYAGLSVLRDIFAAFGVFAFATKRFDHRIDPRLWLCATLVAIAFYALGVRLDIMHNSELTLGVLAAVSTLFLAIIGPAIGFNLMLVRRLNRNNVPEGDTIS